MERHSHGKSEVLRENKLECHFCHHKLYTRWPKIEPEYLRTERPELGQAEYLFNAHIHITVTSPL